MKPLAVPLTSLLAVPIAPLLAYGLGASPLPVFATGAVGIAVLADWVRRATEQVAERAGPAIGGLLSVSFGSLAEIILAFFVLMEGKADVVRAQLAGSIIGTSLFGLGIAVVIGCIGRDELRFRRERAGQLSSMLVLVVVALLLPAIFDAVSRMVAHQARPRLSDEELSIGVSVVLLFLYGANLVYTLVTHRDVFAADEPRNPRGAWPLSGSLGALVVATAAIAWEAKLVSGALEGTAGALALPPPFLGIVVLAMVGTASDIVAASVFARSGKMGLVMSICVGSSIQVALVVAPLLVLGSWALGHPMTLVFGNPLHLFAIAATALTVNAIAGDGDVTWFEGVLLLGVYALLGLAFFFIDPAA